MAKKNTFVIINSYFIGDILLTNSLVQNIKRLFPDSKVVSLTSPKLVDIAKYQQGVDDVIVWDRKGEHKNFINMLNFAWKFPYKDIYACFPIYGLDRPVMLSRLLGAKYVLAPRNGFFSKFLRNSKYKYTPTTGTMQSQMLSHLKGVTKEELIDCPMKFNPPSCDIKVPEKDYTVLIPTTTRLSKDIPLETILEILKNFSRNKFVLLGQGEQTKKISDGIKNAGIDNIIDFTNKTNLIEAANIIKNAKCVISADTGLMHLACALGVKTVTIFYETFTKAFMPDESLYDIKVIKDDTSTQNVIETIKNFTEMEFANE